MNKPCKHCCSSGHYIGMPIYNEITYTGGPPAVQIYMSNCKYCGGKGYIDEEEIISVPRKFVKDEYFNNQ